MDNHISIRRRNILDPRVYGEAQSRRHRPHKLEIVREWMEEWLVRGSSEADVLAVCAANLHCTSEEAAKILFQCIHT